MDGDFFFGTSSLCEIQNDKINNFYLNYVKLISYI